MERNARSRLAAPAAALLILITSFSAAPAAAITTTWTGAAPADDRWSNDANWDLGAPGDLDRVRFSVVGGLSIQDIPGLMLYSVDMTGFAGTLALQEPLQVMSGFTAAGTLDMEAGALAVAGHLRIDGIALASGAAIDVGGDLVINGSMSAPAADITVAGAVDGGAGASLAMGAGTLLVGADARFQSYSSVSFAANGTLHLAAGGARLLTFGPSAVALGSLVIDHSAATDLTTMQRSGGPPVTIGGQLRIRRGILDVECGLDVTGTTTVEADGELRNDSAAGLAWTFRAPVVVDSGKLRATAAACTLGFAAGGIADLDLNGSAVFEIRGSAEPGRVRLQQDGVAGDMRWVLDHAPTATATVEAAEVQDGEARPGPILTVSSIDAGNNVGWVFGPKMCRWTGAAPGNSLWSDDANWTPSRPVSGDSVRFEPVGGSSIADIAGLSLAALDMTGYSGAVSLQRSLSVTGDVRVEGTLALGSLSLNIGGDLDVAGRLDAATGTLAVAGGTLIAGRFDGLAGAVGQFTGGVTVGPLGDFQAPATSMFASDVEIQDGGRMWATRPASSLVFGGDVVVRPGGWLRVLGAGSQLFFGVGRTLRAQTGAGLEIAGQPLGLVSLRKDGPSGGLRWLADLEPGSTAALRCVRVQDSDASPGEPAVALDSANDGNNVNWVFDVAGTEEAPLPASLAASLTPNPFRVTVTARVAVPRPGPLRVRIWDLQGRLVRTLVDGAAEGGWHSVQWDGSDERGRRIESGLYFWRVETGSEALTGTLARVR